MHIEHIAIWVNDLEKARDFYMKYFNLSCNEKYHNPMKNFSSYFLSFPSGARLELMHIPLLEIYSGANSMAGLAHIAISLGSKEEVDRLTDQIAQDGYTIAGAPRTTGDGYYESVVLDPEGNQIELTV